MSALPRSRLQFAAGSLALLASLACRPPSSKIPIEKLQGDDAQQSQGEARELLEPLPVERPTDLLPAEVPVLAEASDPAQVLALISALDKYPEFAMVRTELRDRLGADPLDPQDWATLGFDVHGPAGFGLIDVESGAGFAYLTLADEAKFEETLARIIALDEPNEDYVRMEIDGARVHRLGRKASVVVRERVMMLLLVDDPDEAPRDYVVSAATLDPRESLGHSERFAWARAQLKQVDDGYVFLNPASLLAQYERQQQQRRSYGLRYAEEELARARKVGEPPEVIREYEAQVERERSWERERQARDAAGRELVNALFGSLGAFVAAADLRDDGIVAHARALFPGDSLLRRLFVVPERESPLISALAEAPIYLADGRVDLQVMLEALALLARAEGGSLDELNREFMRETGIDLITGLIPALSGEGGFALTQDKRPDPKRLAEVRESLGVAAYLGLREPDAIRKLLDQVAQDKRMGGALVRAKRGDGWVLRVPDWREVELAIVGDRLVAATDSKLAARVRDAERGALGEALSAEHPLQGPIPTPAARMYGRFVGFAFVEAREPWRQDAEAMLYDMNSHHALNPDEAAKVPRSREFKKKFAELEEVVDELQEIQLRQAQRDFEQLLEYTEKLGDIGWQLEPVGDGLAFAGQWRFAPGMTPLELSYELYRDMGRGNDQADYERVSSKAWALVDELRVIRQADLDAAAAKKSPAN